MMSKVHGIDNLQFVDRYLVQYLMMLYLPDYLEEGGCTR